VATSNQPNAVAVQRAFAILELLDSSRRGWNISEMSRKLSIPKSTTHVLVLTLERLGYIRRYRSSRRYQLSLKIFALGREVLKTMPLPELALPHMRWLVEETKLTAHLGILERNHVVFIQKVDGPSMIKFDTYIGKRSHLHCTGLGKSLLAYQPDEVLQALLSNHSFHRFTEKTIVSWEAFRKELSKVRQMGYSMDDEEEELGVRCLASPVLAASGETLAAVSVTGTTSQIRAEETKKLGNLVRQGAARIAASV
jgi:DNA-binding IclR family transcriptional regulator